jgi:transposase
MSQISHTAQLTARQPVGRPKRIHDDYLQRLQELATQSPKAFGYSFDRWTAYWLQRHLAQEFQLEVTERHINRLLRQMGLSTRQQARFHNGQTANCAKIIISDLEPSQLS